MSSAPFIFVPVVAVVPVVPVGTTYWRQFLRLIAILTIFAHWKCKVVLLHMPKAGTGSGHANVYSHNSLKNVN